MSRELALIKVRADATTRGQIIEAVNLFRAKVVDVSAESLIVEATGTPGKLTALLQLLEPYGIREIAQSGMVTLGPRSARHRAPASNATSEVRTTEKEIRSGSSWQ